MFASRRGTFHSAANYFAASVRRALLALVSLVALAFLWTASSSCTGHVRTEAVVAHPSLVYVEPGIWVVAESDYPIFYLDNYYWMFHDGYWYRSRYYTGGWVYRPRSHVPARIGHIRYPRVYRNYRARPGMRTRKAPTRDHRRSRETRPPRRATPPRPRTRSRKKSP
jgi:hypothetical protein